MRRCASCPTLSTSQRQTSHRVSASASAAAAGAVLALHATQYQIESIAKVDAFHGSMCFASCSEAPDLAACLASPSDPEMGPIIFQDNLPDRHKNLMLKIRQLRRRRKRFSLSLSQSDSLEDADCQ